MKTTPALLILTLVAACGLPAAPEHATARPPPTRQAVELCWLETAGTTALGGFGAAGWARASTWEATTSALLVRHPLGTVLIDAGLALDPERDASELSAWGRFIFHQTAARNVPRADLRTLLTKDDLAHLKGIVLSHAHADHGGGVPLVPGVPVWVAPEEARFVRDGLAHGSNAVMPATARELTRRMVEISFASKPYENFDRSWDVFGDGTIVVVPTPGHTPGSVATFVSLGSRRLVHVGDLINLQESIERRVPKSLPMRQLTDEDVSATNREVSRLVQLHEAEPSLTILPAHDRAAYVRFFGDLPKGSTQPRCVRTTAAN